MAPVDQGYAKIDEFVQLSVERPANTGIETQKILEHLRAVGQRLLRVSGFSAKRFLVDFFYFGRRRFGTDQGNARHRILQKFVLIIADRTTACSPTQPSRINGIVSISLR